jgi:NADH-quinone oxidoreductase subunit L
MWDLFKNEQFLLWAVVLSPLIGFLINGLFGRRLSLMASGGIASAAVIFSFVCAISLFTQHLPDKGVIASAPYLWMSVGEFQINFGLYLDRLSGLYMMVVTGVASLIHIYSVGYMSHDKAFARYFSYLNLFVFAMLMLVLGDSLVTLFLGWEGVGLCSYLLIGFWYKDLKNTNAGMKAFIANRVGDFGFMIGMFLIFWHFGTLAYAGDAGLMTRMTELTASGAVNTTLLNWACIFLLIGAAGKSAQIPLYVWLPDAMAGPTPVSALIHAATMVTAGIYMLARLNFVFVDAQVAMALVAIVGAVTALFAGTIALVQRDIKKVLAYSTISQLGFMFLAAGLGMFHLAVFHVFTHAFFKALLFMGSGSVIHSLEHTLGHGNPDSQDMWKMGGLKDKMPITCWTMVIGAAALAGIPLTAGFFSKDAILYAAMHYGGLLGWSLYLVAVAAAVCTAFYSARLIGLTFFGKWRGDEKTYAHANESPGSMSVPLVVLAILSLFAGYLLLPPAVGVHHPPFAEWLGPVWAQAQAALPEGSKFIMPVEHTAAEIIAEWVNIIISSLIAIGVFMFGFVIYSRPENLSKLDKLAYRPTAEGVPGEMTPWYRVLLNKYYVDELYDMVFVRPVKVCSDVLFVIVDVVIIDLLLVNGSAMATKLSSDLGRRLQTGFLRHYLYAFAIGVVVLTGAFLWIVQK